MQDMRHGNKVKLKKAKSIRNKSIERNELEDGAEKTAQNRNETGNEGRGEATSKMNKNLGSSRKEVAKEGAKEVAKEVAKEGGYGGVNDVLRPRLVIPGLVHVDQDEPRLSPAKVSP